MRDRLTVILAYDDVNLIDIAGPLQAFQTANDTNANSGANSGTQTYRLVTTSERGGQVLTAPGLPIMTEPLNLLQGKDIDTIIVPGGLPSNGPFGLDSLVGWLAIHGPKVRRLCSVCTGAFLLADAGLLTGKRVTTHWSRHEELQARHPDLQLDADRIFINDGRVWTSGGVTAGIDLALALIEADLGHQVAADTARQLVMFMRRPGGQSQFTVPATPRTSAFATLHAWIASHLHEDLRVERLAEQAAMSPRNFARVYVAETGFTPAKAIEAIRLEAACRALETTDLPIKTIAIRVGLATEQNLRRVFHRQFGILPSDYRLRFRARNPVDAAACSSILA